MTFADLVEEYESPLVRFALRYVDGDLEHARDAVQETFLRLCREDWEAMSERLRPWLYRVCRQRAIDLSRKHRPVNVDHQTLETSRAASDPSADPVAMLIGSERKAALRRAVGSLPDKEREAVLLKFQEGLSYREISEVTGHSNDYVGVLIHRGIQRLRAALV